MIQIKDQIGSLLTFKQAPLRIVSLVPSISELLWDLELENELVGVTKFCIHPVNLRKEKITVGGTKNVKISRVLELQPDLVIANLEENTKQEIEELQQQVPTFVSDISTIDDMIAFIQLIGNLCNRQSATTEVIRKLSNTIAELPKKEEKKSAIYLIWNKPFMSIGGDTFISHMMEKVGYVNCLQQEERYPVLTADDIRKIAPEELLLSSEPYPFNEKHRDQLQEQFPNIKVKCVDGEAFSWYGSRLYKVKDYLHSI
jgi:ABC-type Fe3+-hydroxamate transport system substrate-binding protein